MKGIKHILFGLTLIVFGVGLFFICETAGWGVLEVIALLIPIVGLAFAVEGYFRIAKLKGPLAGALSLFKISS